MIKNNQLYGFPYLELTGFHDHESGVLDKRTEDILKKYIKEEAIPHLDKLVISYTEKANAARCEINKCTDEGYKLSIKFFIDKEKKYKKELNSYLLSIAKFSNWISLLKSSLENKLTIDDTRCLPCFR